MKPALLALLAAAAALAQEPLTAREKALLERIEMLEKRLAAVEAATGLRAAASPASPPVAPPVARQEPTPPAAPPVSVSAVVDGYYGYNFNNPASGENALRAYDVTARGFGLNQAVLLLERPPDAAAGRRTGMRVDLMFGQATETLQGSAANEPRPAVFRHLFQAYGTWVAPVGKGLTLDFGKWASSFGLESNYTKDQFNYSRSYWFSFLPYYHAGLRAAYPVSRRVMLSYWLTNGLNQTEDFNSSPGQAVLLNYARPRLSANLNYFGGREQRREGLRQPRGRAHLANAYATWQPVRRLTLAGEANYAINRAESTSPPSRVTGGALYARYQLNPRFTLATRFVRLNDSAGWYSGAKNRFTDVTTTLIVDVASGFQTRWEYRRDSALRLNQNTAQVGLIWWFGARQGVW